MNIWAVHIQVNFKDCIILNLVATTQRAEYLGFAANSSMRVHEIRILNRFSIKRASSIASGPITNDFDIFEAHDDDLLWLSKSILLFTKWALFDVALIDTALANHCRLAGIALQWFVDHAQANSTSEIICTRLITINFCETHELLYWRALLLYFSFYFCNSRLALWDQLKLVRWLIPLERLACLVKHCVVALITSRSITSMA